MKTWESVSLTPNTKKIEIGYQNSGEVLRIAETNNLDIEHRYTFTMSENALSLWRDGTKIKTIYWNSGVPMMSSEKTINIGSSLSIDFPSQYTRTCVEGFTQGGRFSNISQRGTTWVTIQNQTGGVEYIYTEYNSNTQKLTITNPSTNTTSATITQVYGLANIP